MKNPGFPQGDAHPVVRVTWEDANGFCEWLTKKERAERRIGANQSYRLPKDAEWSAAVGLNEPGEGTPGRKDKKIKDVYPWGTDWPPPRGAGNYDSSLKVDDFEYTSPVGSFKANQYGLYDMGGNVWQWCEDKFNDENPWRVLRGGSWNANVPEHLLSSFRNFDSPDGQLPYGRFLYGNGPAGRARFYGFRVVVVVGPAQ